MDDLLSIEREAFEELEKISSQTEMDSFYTKYLGRKEGALTKILRQLATLPPEERKTVGSTANQLRSLLEEKVSIRQKELETKTLASKLTQEIIDVTLPGSLVKQ